MEPTTENDPRDEMHSKRQLRLEEPGYDHVKPLISQKLRIISQRLPIKPWVQISSKEAKSLQHIIHQWTASTDQIRCHSATWRIANRMAADMEIRLEFLTYNSGHLVQVFYGCNIADYGCCWTCTCIIAYKANILDRLMGKKLGSTYIRGHKYGDVVLHSADLRPWLWGHAICSIHSRMLGRFPREGR